ncbi:DUF485 domain-containing protein [Nonomuraea sp. NPDC050556]|uniref:DUF485 domain-containing protein n=1 Tax=Nonomuraea sp. NPDC050556 TaxID=3364369 RepID=UPI003792B898
MQHRRGETVARGHYAAMANDRRFRLLQKRFRRLAIGVIGSFLGWYLLYISLSAFARDFMARPAFGNINMALLLGVLQFVSTFVLAWRYTRYSKTMIDPLATQLRDEAELRQAEFDRMEDVLAERRRIENWTPPAHRRPRHQRGGRR